MDGLTPAERARLGELAGAVEAGRVRLHRRAWRGPAGALRRLVLWLSRGRAIALGRHVFLPDCCASDIATLAHELTHCAQYEAWGPWQYYRRGAAAQVREALYRSFGVGESPYAYRVEPGKPFEAYGMEQQGQIVEDGFRGDGVALAVTRYRPSDLA